MTEAAPGDEQEWTEAADWMRRARRLGSLRYSDLGPRAVPVPEGVDELAGWLAAAADRWWDAAGRPDPWTLVVDSADDGTLASEFLGLGPECLTLLRYVLVHPDPPPAMAGRLPLEEPAFLFPVTTPDDPDDEAPAAPGVGPLVTCLPAPPAVPGDGAVVAISTVSRLPSDRLEYRDGSWAEVRVAEVDGSLVEVVSPLTEPLPPRIRPRPVPGRQAVLTGATDWLRDRLGTEMRGVVAIVDRWTEDTEPLTGPEVPPLALDQLARVRPPRPPGVRAAVGDLGVVTWRTP